MRIVISILISLLVGCASSAGPQERAPTPVTSLIPSEAIQSMLSPTETIEPQQVISIEESIYALDSTRLQPEFIERITDQEQIQLLSKCFLSSPPIGELPQVNVENARLFRVDSGRKSQVQTSEYVVVLQTDRRARFIKRLPNELRKTLEFEHFQQKDLKSLLERIGTQNGWMVQQVDAVRDKKALDFLNVIQSRDQQAILDYLIQFDPKEFKAYRNIDLNYVVEFLKMLEVDIDLSSMQLLPAQLMMTGEQVEYVVNGRKHGEQLSLVDSMYLNNNETGQKMDWAYLSYYPYMNTMARTYLDLIQAGDFAQLAEFMTVDDLEYSDAGAKTIIKTYKKYFSDVRKASLNYLGRGRFEVVSGQKKHAFSIVYGDGLMGVNDDFAPEAQ